MDETRRSRFGLRASRLFADSARLGDFAVPAAALWRVDPILAQSELGHELAMMTHLGGAARPAELLDDIVADAVPEMDPPRPRRFRTIQDRPKDLRVASC
jgi:hypothetical protein